VEILRMNRPPPSDVRYAYNGRRKQAFLRQQGGQSAARPSEWFNETAIEEGRGHRRVGKANGSRECAPGGVPTIQNHHALKVSWWARRKERLCPPYKAYCGVHGW
jgi:hypothetical protein